MAYLPIRKLQVEIVLNLLSHCGWQLLGTHVVIDDQQMLIKLSTCLVCRMQYCRDGRDQKGIKDGTNIETSQCNPVFNCAPFSCRIARCIHKPAFKVHLCQLALNTSSLEQGASLTVVFQTQSLSSEPMLCKTTSSIVLPTLLLRGQRRQSNYLEENRKDEPA